MVCKYNVCVISECTGWQLCRCIRFISPQLWIGIVNES